MVLETPDADSALARDAPPHSLVVVTPLRQYVLAAESDDDKRAWVAALGAACSIGRQDVDQSEVQVETTVTVADVAADGKSGKGKGAEPEPVICDE